MIYEQVQRILKLQADTVAAWHSEEIDIDVAVDRLMAECEGKGMARGKSSFLCNDRTWLHTICRQHTFNFLLWHEEDIARSPTASDFEIAKVKRAIDGYNQNRNDWIEKVDDYLSLVLKRANVPELPSARLNTETPGSAIDRLSIMSLRLYHLEEQLEREDVDQEHRQKVEAKIQICQLQKRDLAQSLAQLLEDIFSGQKRHQTYRQCKMYNDPTLNPKIYQSDKEVA